MGGFLKAAPYGCGFFTFSCVFSLPHLTIPENTSKYRMSRKKTIVPYRPCILFLSNVIALFHFDFVFAF